MEYYCNSKWWFSSKSRTKFSVYCNPNQSSFVTVTDLFENDRNKGLGVANFTVELSAEYADGLYDTCKEVKKTRFSGLEGHHEELIFLAENRLLPESLKNRYKQLYTEALMENPSKEVDANIPTLSIPIIESRFCNTYGVQCSAQEWFELKNTSIFLVINH